MVKLSNPLVVSLVKCDFTKDISVCQTTANKQKKVMTLFFIFKIFKCTAVFNIIIIIIKRLLDSKSAFLKDHVPLKTGVMMLKIQYFTITGIK